MRPILMDKAQERKNTPVFTGVIAYFPRAIKEIARVSVIGNEQHNPGQPLHWAYEKSKDEADAGLRHAMDHAMGEKFDDDGARHLAKKAWRALAELERELRDEEYANKETEPDRDHRNAHCENCGNDSRANTIL